MRSSDWPDSGKVRRLVDELLLDDSDLAAFCLDYFPEVYRRFSMTMDRVAKVNLLLVHADRAELLAQLRKQQLATPAKVDAALLERLEELGEKREAAILSGHSTDAIDEEILLLKRQSRQGPRLCAGEILDGRYKLREIIGSGGFADVWLAWDRRRAQSVAVKVLHGRYSSEKTQWQRFARGARSMARLSQRHPGFVKVLGDPTEDGGYHYFAMEYLPGGDLRKAVLSGRLSCAQAVDAVLKVAAALHYAHEQGMVHRDVKPQNILLDENGTARLGDFDLVAVPDSTGGTRSGPLGTFIYAAPEEMENAKRVDRRSDIYSLGMTALFALYGKDLPHKVIRSTADFVAELSCSAATKRALIRAIAWESQERQATAEQFHGELHAGLLSAELEEPAPLDTSTLDLAKERNSPRLPLPGERIGKLIITKRLGQGGTCAIFAALDEDANERFAVKVLLPELSHYHAVRSQVLAEAQLLAGFSHPGVVGTYYYGTLPNKLVYVVGEYLAGPTLRQRRSAKHNFSVVEALLIATELADALRAVHKAGLVHGNLRPDEIILCQDPSVLRGERAKLIDLGGSRLTGRSAHDGDTDQDAARSIYISPEQIRGTVVDGRADVYSLGVIMYELLSGHPPFRAGASTLENHLYAQPVLLGEISPSIPEPLSSLVNRMLAKKPENRPELEELTVQLGRLLS